MKKKSALREWIESIVIAGSLAIFLRTFFFQIYKIPTNSMVPTLKPGDKIFVSKLVYGPKVPFTSLRIPGIRKPERGEVIVFVPPCDRRKAYVKRLVGLPGEHIVIKDGNIYVNGKLITQPNIANHYYYSEGREYKYTDVVVPQGEYFVLGDNSISSFDSRCWGFVDEKDIIGKAIFIWWPPKRIGMIE
ncbi:MAG: signal peptidase I [Candidatus Omnitrophota bacterium]|nr:MAG: signal peptidase I [Candidatus Omnitrophota bacterium]